MKEFSPRSSRRPRPGPLPRYRLVLHRDADADLTSVVRCVMELTGLARAEATQLMWQAYLDGRAVLLTTWLERGELYAELFAQRGLRTSLEPC